MLTMYDLYAFFKYYNYQFAIFAVLVSVTVCKNIKQDIYIKQTAFLRIQVAKTHRSYLL